MPVPGGLMSQCLCIYLENMYRPLYTVDFSKCYSLNLWDLTESNISFVKRPLGNMVNIRDHSVFMGVPRFVQSPEGWWVCNFTQNCKPIQLLCKPILKNKISKKPCGKSIH